MKKLYLLFFFLIVFFYPLNAQYQLIGGSDNDVGTCAFAVGPFNFIKAGYYQSNDGDFNSNYGKEDCFITCSSWTTVFGGSQHDYIYDITGENGNIYIAGTSDSNDYDIPNNQGAEDYLVAKLDSNGQLLWVKTFGGSGTDIATSILFFDNYIWVLGYSNSSDGDVTGNYGSFDLWLIKLDTDGNLIWQKNYGGSLDDRSSDMEVLISGFLPSDLFLAGYSKSSDGDLNFNHGKFDYWLLGVNSTNGDIVWQQSYGGNGDDIKPSISTFSGLVDIVGSSNSTNGDITNPLGGYDVWWLSGYLGSNGLVIDSFRNIGGSNDDFGTDVMNFPFPICGSPMIFIIFYSDSSDGTININHGGYDAWLVHTDYNNFEFFNYGGQNDDKFLRLPSFNSYEFAGGDPMVLNYCIGSSASNDIPGTNPHGQEDAWFVFGNPGAINEYPINIKIYPNPVTEQVHIQVENHKIKTLQLYDLTGKLLINDSIKSFQDEYSLNLQNLKPGNYLLKIFTDKGEAIKKLIKTH